MIPVHRIKGDQLFVNADLIESLEVASGADRAGSGSSEASNAGRADTNTVLTLIDGRKAIVTETPAEIVELIRAYRASIIVEAEQQRAARHTPPNLRVVRGEEI